MSRATSLFSDWLLRRAMNSKRREHLRSSGARWPEPTGPDPLDHWWRQDPVFRRSVIDAFRDWDGMRGIVDVSAVKRVLQEPLPYPFVKFIVPALLTLYHFQQIVERELGPVG